MPRRAVALLALLLVTRAASAQDAARDEAAIRAVRLRHNQAIAAHDLQGIAAPWSPDRVGVSSRNGRTVGLEAERASWAELLATRPGVVFVRTPTAIEANPRWGQAAEVGSWTGRWKAADGEVHVGGSYFAKWRKEQGQWRILAETYVQLVEERRKAQAT